jgi:hypothetical protein
MHKLRLLGVVLLLIWGAIAAQAQTATLTVEPDTGGIGTVFTITATNLTPNSDFTIDFIFADSGDSIFSTSRRSDAAGGLTFNVNSEPSDPPGVYRVEIRQGSTVVASDEFTLNGDAPAEGGQNNTPPPAANTGVDLRVIPDSAGAGATHSVMINGLQPEQSVTLIVTDAAGTEVYNRDRAAGENGRLTVDIFTSKDSPAGIYTVTVFDASNTALAQDTFTIEEPIGRNGVIEIEPTVVDDAAVYVLNITEVKPFADLSVTIASAEGEEVFFTRLRATVEGTARVEFTPEADTPNGDYQITVREGDIQVAAATLTISAEGVVAAANINLLVTPVAAPAGTLRIITITGLTAGESVLLNISRDGEILERLEKTADVNGILAISISTFGSNEPGEYVVTLRRAAGIAAEVVVEVESAAVVETPPASQSGVAVTIDPLSGPIGTVYNVRVTGLNANETVTIAVQLDGRTIFATERTSNNSGIATLSLNSEEGDSPGTYSIVVLSGDTELASTDFAIGADTVQPEQPQPTDDISIQINPVSGVAGTVHTITIGNLNPGEPVSIEVLFAGESVYNTNRTADNAGAVVLNLAAEETDPSGDYTVRVERGGALAGEAVLTVLEPDATETDTTVEPALEANVVIFPASGTPGTVHRVEVTNLAPGETITVEVLFDGENVYTTEKTADNDGIVTLDLAADASDPSGDYTVNIVRANAVIATSVFAVEATDETDTTETTEPDETTLELTLTPDSGAIGTRHEVRIVGLDANEVITVDVLFDGDVVYTTDKTADRAGIVAFNLVTEDGDPAGVYTVQVVRLGSVVASADLTIGDEAADTTVTVPTASGDELLFIEDALADGAAQQTYTFEGFEGDVVVISLVSPDFDTYVILQDDTESELISNDDVDFGAGIYDSAIGPYILPYTGNYTIVVTSYDALFNNEFVNGRFTLEVETATLQALTFGEATGVEFTAESGSQYFTFEAEIGDIVAVNVTGEALDTSLTLLDPFGSIVVEDDDSGLGFNPEIARYIVRYAGTYTAILAPYTRQDTGDVEIVVDREFARQLGETPQNVTITPKQTSDIVVMEGRRNDEVLLDVSIISGSTGSVSISVYQNDVVLMTYTSTSIPDGTVLGFAVPDDGAVSIIVEDTSGTSNAVIELATR